VPVTVLSHLRAVSERNSLTMSDSTTIPLKQCVRKENCIHPNGPYLPATTEHYTRDKSKKDGLNTICKRCRSEICTRSYIKHRAESNARLRDRYHNDPVFREAHTRRTQTWERKSRGYRAKADPIHRKARTAVSNAIRLGKLAKPSCFACVLCGKAAQQYHHESYEPERWLDVTPMCTRCHNNYHRVINE
jgi:hypothetical protein